MDDVFVDGETGIGACPMGGGVMESGVLIPESRLPDVVELKFDRPGEFDCAKKEVVLKG